MRYCYSALKQEAPVDRPARQWNKLILHQISSEQQSHRVNVLTSSHHRICWVEDVEEAPADGFGHDVVLVTGVSGPNPSQSQEHSQRRAHAEEVLHLQLNYGALIHGGVIRADHHVNVTTSP